MSQSVHERVEDYFGRAGQLLLVRMPRSDDPRRELRRLLMYLEMVRELSEADVNASGAFDTAIRTCRRYAELLTQVRPLGGGPSPAEVEAAHRQAGDALLFLHAQMKQGGNLVAFDQAADQVPAR